MHKGVVLLTKAENKDEAVENVNEFMEQYGEGDVWDWFSIGGRWTGQLAHKDEFDKWVKPFLAAKEGKKNGPDGWISQKTVTDNLPEIEAKWVAMGFKSPSPYSDHYKLPNEGGNYDVLPLKECIDIIKRDWVKDLKIEKEKAWKELVEQKEKEDRGEKGAMSGYYAGLYKNIDYGCFCFETNVFNISEDVAEELPDEEEYDQYFAVMVDMHN